MFKKNNNNKNHFTVNMDDAEILNSINEIWFSWITNINSSNEVRQFFSIISLLKSKKSLTISTNDLIKIGINPLNNLVIKKLLHLNYIKIDAHKLIFTIPVVEKDNFLEHINSQFKTQAINYSKYPSSYLSKIKSEDIETVEISKLHWHDFESDTFENKIIEVSFLEYNLPPIVITQKLFPDLIEISKNKLAHYVTEMAEKNELFFSKYIKPNLKDGAHFLPKMSSVEISQVKHIKNDIYRESYTNLVMKKIIYNNDLLQQFLVNFDFSIRPDLVTYFPSAKPESFDLLHSLLILKEIYLNDINETNQKLENIANSIFESAKLYSTETEIFEQIYRDSPQIPKHLFDNLYQQFQNEYLNKKNGHKIYKYNLNSKMPVYFHSLNFNRFLTVALNAIDQEISNFYLQKWVTKLNRHQFLFEMISQDSFNRSISEYIDEKDHLLSVIISSSSTYSNVASLNELSRLTNRLLIHGRNDISQVFNLKISEIYSNAIKVIYSKKSYFGKILFKLIHWLYFKSFANVPNNDEVLEPESTEKDILNNINITNMSELSDKIENCWNSVPSNSIERKELEANIKTDTFNFFKNKSEVRTNNLQIIIDKQINRIIKVAPHLSSNRTTIISFTKLYLYKCIITNSQLRKKIRF